MSSIVFATPYYTPHIVGGAEISTQLVVEALAGAADVLTVGPSNTRRSVNGITVFEKSLVGLSAAWESSLDSDSMTVPEKLACNVLPLIPLRHLVLQYRDFFRSYGHKCLVINSNSELLGRASLWKAAHDLEMRTILVLRDPLLLERSTLGINWSIAYRKMIRAQMKWIDEIVAPSQYMIDLYASYGIFKPSYRVIPNAVTADLTPTVPVTKKRGVLFVGSVTEDKGVLTALKSVRLFQEGSLLTVIGRGPLVDAVQGEPHVRYRGWMDHRDVLTEMAGARALILPSEWPEAFGRVIIEAVDVGTLVVGSDAGAIPEVLNYDGRYLFPAGNAVQLADRVNRILSLSADEYDLEVAELKSIFQRFSLGEYAAAWKRLLLDTP